MQAKLSKIRQQSKKHLRVAYSTACIALPSNTFDSELKISYMEMITEALHGFEIIWARKTCMEQMQIHRYNEI